MAFIEPKVKGWIEVPLFGPPIIPLVEGTIAWRKGNLRVLLTPIEQYLDNDGLWRHVSVSHHARYPTWDEILDVRYSFFDDDVEVIQILPRKSEYVNIHPNCFHLWSRIK